MSSITGAFSVKAMTFRGKQPEACHSKAVGTHSNIINANFTSVNFHEDKN